LNEAGTRYILLDMHDNSETVDVTGHQTIMPYGNTFEYVRHEKICLIAAQCKICSVWYVQGREKMVTAVCSLALM